jgi:hypothetical protein
MAEPGAIAAGWSPGAAGRRADRARAGFQGCAFADWGVLNLTRTQPVISELATGPGTIVSSFTREVPRRVVALLASLLILALFVVPIFPYAKRRPVGTPLTWGEAMVAGTYVFFLMWWAYGTVPHLWLTWTSNELNWRPDVMLWNYEMWGRTPFGFLEPQESSPEGWFPMTITMQTVRDLIVVLIYVGFLAGQMWLWAVWQKRGSKVSAEVATSDFGRPLVKKA